MNRRDFLTSGALSALGIAASRPPLGASAAMKPGYACEDHAGIYFEDNEVKRVVSDRAGAKGFYVSVVDGRVVERVLEPEPIV